MAEREQLPVPLYMLMRTCICFGILVAVLVGIIVFLVYYQDCKTHLQELNECRVQLSRESMSSRYEKGGLTSCEADLQKCQSQIEQDYFNYSELISLKATRPYLLTIIATLMAFIIGHCIMACCWSHRHHFVVIPQRGPQPRSIDLQ